MTNKDNVLEQVSCSLCDSESNEILPYFKVNTPEGDLNLRKCKKCGLVYQSPRLTELELEKLYDQEYFEQGHYGGKDKERDYFNPDEQEDLASFHNKIINRISSLKEPPAKLLEIGCAGGHFLLSARDKGYSVQGVEISDYASSQARERYKLDVKTGILENISFEQNSFDVVYLKDILEHVRNPLSFLQECHRILNDSGLLVILVPNYLDSPIMRLYIRLWKSFPFLRKIIWGNRNQVILDEPFHLFEFTHNTMAKLLQKALFEIVRSDNYTLAPLPAKMGNLLINSVRFIMRWMYYLSVSMKILEGDRLDFYCTKKIQKSCHVK